MHPINKTNFGELGLAVMFYNGTASVPGYIVKQLGTDRFIVSDGTHTVTAYLVATHALAVSLGESSNVNPPGGNTVSGAYQMTIPVPFTNPTSWVTHIYDSRIDVINSSNVTSVLSWSLGSSVDGATTLSTYPQAYDAVNVPVYAAGTFGGPTVLTYATAPANATHGTASHPVVVATSPVAPASYITNFYLTTSATVLPTTGAIPNTSYSNGSFGVGLTYTSAGTFFVWAILSDTSYKISSAIVIS